MICHTFLGGGREDLRPSVQGAVHRPRPQQPVHQAGAHHPRREERQGDEFKIQRLNV